MANIRIVQRVRIGFDVALGHNFSTFKPTIDVSYPELMKCHESNILRGCAALHPMLSVCFRTGIDAQIQATYYGSGAIPEPCERDRERPQRLYVVRDGGRPQPV